MALSIKKETEVVTLKLSKNNVQNILFNLELFPDVSGSMQSYYGRGRVMEAVMQRCLALATKVDPDGKVQITPFSNRAVCLGDFEADVFEDILDTFITRCRSATPDVLWDGTDYATPFKISNKIRIEEIEKVKNLVGDMVSGLKNLFGFKKEEPKQQAKIYPRLIMFLTDGENYGNDSDFLSRLEEAVSDGHSFVMLVGVGGSSYSLLKEAANMAGVDFVQIQDINKLNDESFYDLILTDEFSAWLKSRPAN